MRTFLICSSALLITLTSSCNTFIGIGRDLRLAGQGLENTASKASGKSSKDNEHSAAPVY